MIVRSLEVEGVRCFLEPVRFEFARDGFTILSGPNGSGKSTLIDAMRRCLLDAHGSAAAADLRPWSDGRPSRVVLEFDHGGVRYLLTKQFVSKKQARLERKDGRAWKLVEEGREADEAVRQMLRAGGRGDAGLLGVLWSPQGQLPMEAVSGGVLEDIRASLGAQMAGAGGIAFEKQLRKAYEAAWQPARKQPKRGRIHDIEQELNHVRATADAARATVRDAEEQGKAAETLRSEIAKLNDRLNTTESQLRTASAQAEERERLERNVAELARQHQSQDKLFQELWRRSESIRIENERRGQLVAATPELVATLEERRRLERQAGDRAGSTRQEALAASQPDPELQAAIHAAERAAEWTRRSAELAALEQKLARLSQLSASADAIRTELGVLHAPDPATRDGIRDAIERQKLAQVRLEKLELRLEVQAESALEIEVVRGKPAGRRQIAAGKTQAFRGDQVSVRLPGIASLQLAGPETDRPKWEREAETAEAALRTLCAPFGQSDISVLNGLTDKRAMLEAELRGIERLRSEVLGTRSEEELGFDREGLAERQRQIERDEPQWAFAPPDPVAMRRRADDLAANREALRAHTQAEWGEATRQHSSRLAERQRAETAAETSRIQLEDCERRLRELESDGKNGDHRGRELDELRRSRDAAAAELGIARQQLDRTPSDAGTRMETLCSSAAQLRQSAAEAARNAAERETTQRTLLSLGPYTNLVEAEAEIEALQLESDREQLRLDALRLLWETYEDEKKKALDGIAEPVSARATGILSKIAGESFADLKLSSDFSETAIWPAAKAKEAELDEMSGGEQEQIALAVRLALAGYVTEAEPHLIVLDDVLLNTDSARLGRILALLEETRDRMQVLIVTCHPERYKRLRGARQVTLPLAAAAIATE